MQALVYASMMCAISFSEKRNLKGKTMVTEFRNDEFRVYVLRYVSSLRILWKHKSFYFGIYCILSYLARKCRFHKTESLPLDSLRNRVAFDSWNRFSQPYSRVIIGMVEMAEETAKWYRHHPQDYKAREIRVRLLDSTAVLASVTAHWATRLPD